MIFKDKLLIVEAGVTEDDYGNEVVDWDNGETVARIAAHVDYRESVRDGNRVTTELVAYCRPFDFNPQTQRILWNGKFWTIEGDELLRIAQGRTHHVEIPLVRIN